MEKDEITKEDFLARCANAWDAGLCTTKRLGLLSSWSDAVMRYEAAELGGDLYGGQRHIFTNFVQNEIIRLEINNSDYKRLLANDVDGYALIQLTAILSHPCQICATDPKAWWTRAGFCPHRKKFYEPDATKS